MKITIHRGAKEIGGSCVEISTARTRVIVDLGLPLVAPWNKKDKLDSSAFSRKSSKELLDIGVLPAVKGLYAMDGDEKRVDALILSHPHQDHYGLLGHIRSKTPVYLSDGAKKIIAASDIFLPVQANIKNPVVINDRKAFDIGDIKVTPYLVDHSGFGAMAFLIENDGKKIFYSGDFRAHGRKAKLFQKFLRTAPSGVDCLLMEGTTLGRSGEPPKTEDEIENQIVQIAKKYAGLKLFYASGQNIDRLVSFYRAAIKTNKFLVVDLYTAYVLDSLGVPSIPHPNSKFERLKVFYTKPLMIKIARAKLDHLFKKYRPFEIKTTEIAKNPGQAFLMCRQSLLSDIEPIKNFENAVLTYSMYEGYRRDSSFENVQSFMDRHKIAFEYAHTSGHAGVDDLKKLVKALNPKILIPIHTFNPERYAELWPNTHPFNDGQVFEI